MIAWSRAQPVADGAKAGLTLDKIGASWTLMVDQCLPYLLGVKVFVQDPVTLEHHLWPAPWPLQVIQAAAACTFAGGRLLGGRRGRRGGSGPSPSAGSGRSA